MKRYFAFTFALMALAACDRNADPVGPDTGSVQAKVQIDPIITRATEVNFEDGDQIGLTMAKVNGTTNYADNSCLTFAEGVFSGDLMWYTDAYSEADMYAYYPYDADGTPASFAVETDQTEGIGGSDLMAASKSGVLPTINSVSMVFKHMMTKIVVKIDNQTGEEISEVLIKNSIPAAVLDLKNLSVEADPSVEAADIKAYEQTSDTEYTAIIVPQTVALNLTVAFSSMTMSQPLASMTLKPGGQYTIDVRILAEGMEVTASGEIENWTDEGEIGFEGEGSVEETPVEFEEYEGYFVYDGVEYQTVSLADGNTWMAENLRYVPAGKTVSSDASVDAGIWYPAANAEKTADPALAETLGLLYDAAAAFGVSEITAANAASFEGAQGICPPGWHIPTATDMTGLVGHCSNSDLINTEAAYYDATIKGASIAALGEDGFTWQFASCRNKTNTGGKGSYLVTSYDGTYGVMSYLIGSTMYQVTENEDGSLKNVQYYYMMPLYNASNEKVSVAYGNFLAGASLRCVKDR